MWNKKLCVNLKSDELKDLAATITVLSNEKIKIEKGPVKKKKGMLHM